jgi:hypothetical protein
LGGFVRRLFCTGRKGKEWKVDPRERRLVSEEEGYDKMNGKRGDVKRSKPARTEYFEYRTGLLIKELGF